MNRHVLWQAWTGPGLESVHVTGDAAGVTAESVAIGLTAGRAYTIRYALRCDAGWRVRTLEAWVLGDQSAALALSSDGTGHWMGPDGTRVPALDGCFDVDLPSTVFTNTLPIRRLGMVPGWSEELNVVYVGVPDLSLSVSAPASPPRSRSIATASWWSTRAWRAASGRGSDVSAACRDTPRCRGRPARSRPSPASGSPAAAAADAGSMR